MSARMTILATLLLLASISATAACGRAITEFETIIDSDAQTGNLNKAVHRRIVAELATSRRAAPPAATPKRAARSRRSSRGMGIGDARSLS